MVVSKYGPVPGVGYSCKKSVKNFLELPSEEPEMKIFFYFNFFFIIIFPDIIVKLLRVRRGARVST